jgi:hypothetical protein
MDIIERPGPVMITSRHAIVAGRPTDLAFYTLYIPAPPPVHVIDYFIMAASLLQGLTTNIDSNHTLIRKSAVKLL